MIGKRILAAGLAWTALTQAAAAHPHVFIEIRDKIVFDGDGRIAGVKVSWTFDEFYTLWALEGLDTNQNGVYDEPELKTLAADNVTNLKDYSYFTYATIDGQAVTFGDVLDYGITYENEMLTLHMVLPLTAPADPHAVKFAFKTFDPSFYIAMDLAQKEPIAFEGAAPEGCGFQIDEPNANPDGIVFSDTLANLPEYQNFGAQFARNVRIVCAKQGEG